MAQPPPQQAPSIPQRQVVTLEVDPPATQMQVVTLDKPIVLDNTPIHTDLPAPWAGRSLQDNWKDPAYATWLTGQYGSRALPWKTFTPSQKCSDALGALQNTYILKQTPTRAQLDAVSDGCYQTNWLLVGGVAAGVILLGAVYLKTR